MCMSVTLTNANQSRFRHAITSVIAKVGLPRVRMYPETCARTGAQRIELAGARKNMCVLIPSIVPAIIDYIYIRPFFSHVLRAIVPASITVPKHIHY